MGFNEFLTKLFGNKSQRDLKEITPYVEKVKAVYPSIKELSNDELRGRIDAIKQRIQDYVADERAKVNSLREGIDGKELEEREAIWAEVDKIEKEITDKMEVVFEEVLPEVFAIVKDTARRFAENPEVVVTANDFDRDLATRFNFVRIEAIKLYMPITGWLEVMRSLGIWFITMSNYLVVSFCTKVRLQKWQLVKVRLW